MTLHHIRSQYIMLHRLTLRAKYARDCGRLALTNILQELLWTLGLEPADFMCVCATDSATCSSHRMFLAIEFLIADYIHSNQEHRHHSVI